MESVTAKNSLVVFTCNVNRRKNPVVKAPILKGFGVHDRCMPPHPHPHLVLVPPHPHLVIVPSQPHLVLVHPHPNLRQWPPFLVGYHHPGASNLTCKEVGHISRDLIALCAAEVVYVVQAMYVGEREQHLVGAAVDRVRQVVALPVCR